MEKNRFRLLQLSGGTLGHELLVFGAIVGIASGYALACSVAVLVSKKYILVRFALSN